MALVLVQFGSYPTILFLHPDGELIPAINGVHALPMISRT